MMGHRAANAAKAGVTVALGLLCWGCFSFDNPHDQRRCEPACFTAQRCYDGQCVKGDGGLVGDSSADVSADQLQPDAALRDSRVDLQPLGDSRPDVVIADLGEPDILTADVLAADVLAADVLAADVLAADTVPDSPAQPAWHLYDDFGGSTFDLNKWNYSVDMIHWNNAPITVSQGALVVDTNANDYSASFMDKTVAVHALRLPVGTTAVRFDWTLLKTNGVSYYVQFAFSSSPAFTPSATFTFGCWNSACGPHWEGDFPATGKLEFAFAAGNIAYSHGGSPVITKTHSGTPTFVRILVLDHYQGGLNATIDNFEYYSASSVLRDPGIPQTQTAPTTGTVYDDFSGPQLDPSKWLQDYDPASFQSPPPFQISNGKLDIKGHASALAGSGTAYLYSAIPTEMNEVKFDWEKGSSYGAVSNNLTFSFCDFPDCAVRAGFVFGCWSSTCPHFDGNVPASGTLTLAANEGSASIARNGTTLVTNPTLLEPRYFSVDFRAGDPISLDYVEGTIDNLEFASAAPVVSNAVEVTDNGQWNYVEIPSSAAPLLGTAYTIELWFYWKGHTLADDNNPAVFNPRLASYVANPANTDISPVVELIIHKGDHFLQGRVRYGTLANTTQLSGTTAVTAKVWHHAAMSIVNGQVNIYLDGKLDSTGLLTDAMFNMPSSPWVIGARADGFLGDSYFGLVDEVRLSTGARYSSSFIPQRRFAVDSNTVGLWHLDESSGVSAADSSGKSGSATIHEGCIVSETVTTLPGCP